jgi:lysophospholipase L1-like esterase
MIPTSIKTTWIGIQLAFALLVAPAFAGNAEDYTYLALGDSIPFGMNALLLPPYSFRTPMPDQFIGYPEIVAAAEHLAQSKKEVNASCPGETSGSFLYAGSMDLGCNSPHYQLPAPTIPPFKNPCLLHTCYEGAQMAFAELQLKTNKHINLVTLSIGANDVLLALGQCHTETNACVADALNTYAGNLVEILSRIRAHYQGTLIMTKYYAPTSDLIPIAVAVNDVMTQVAANLAMGPNFAPVQFADGFTAFQVASAGYGGDACAAGLLIPLPASLPAPPCDIHPTLLGQGLLAATVELAMPRH